MLFYPLIPCRIADTRTPASNPIAAQGIRTFQTANSGCGVPASAKALVGNITVVPTQELGFLTVWAAGAAFPPVSLLNSCKGDFTSNFVITELGANAALNVFASDSTHVIIDALGYFSR
jgi:hypothetical protein